MFTLIRNIFPLSEICGGGGGWVCGGGCAVHPPTLTNGYISTSLLDLNSVQGNLIKNFLQTKSFEFPNSQNFDPCGPILIKVLLFAIHCKKYVDYNQFQFAEQVEGGKVDEYHQEVEILIKFHQKVGKATKK